jgi:hypothetical protein
MRITSGQWFLSRDANLYTMLLLMWWNMDPIKPQGMITLFQSPRHAFPLIVGGIIKPVSSLAYVDDAKRYVAVSKDTHFLDEFFNIVQGYCNLLADLSLVIKMGCNVKKCTIYLYNIPEDCNIPEFESIAWSYDSKGPVKGSIATVAVHKDCNNGHSICYQVPKELCINAPPHIKDILATRKYLGVPTNAQLDNSIGKEKIIAKLHQRIGLISAKEDSIRETKIAPNMMVCQWQHFH